MRPTDRAILLLAGRGGRLGSLTENRPKCLLEVGGMSILERALKSLSAHGVHEAVLVVGYRDDQIRHFFGSRYADVTIQYVINDRHAETNTAYSLWLARSYLNTGGLLIEGDILLDLGTLQRVSYSSPGKSVWAAVPVAPGNDEGILLDQNNAGYVTAAQLVGGSNHTGHEMRYKCAGIQLLTADMARALAASLDEVVAEGSLRIYADLVLSKLLTNNSVRLCSLEGLRWAEVDSVEDLHRAQELFKGKDHSSVVRLKRLQDGEAEYGPAS